MVETYQTVSVSEAQELWQHEDFFELGRRAQARRSALFPGHLVTYFVLGAAEDSKPADERRIVFEPDFFPWGELLQAGNATAVIPVWSGGATAVDYLKLLAVCRLMLSSAHIQLDAAWSGLKVAQIALAFGADDFGNIKAGTTITEEEIRCVIRDAGFVPKRRDRGYRFLALD